MPLKLEQTAALRLKTLPPSQTVFFFPVGPIEDHGPHLPLGLDLITAEKLAFLAAERLERELPGWTGVIMPPAPLGIDSNTREFAITVRGHVLRDWLVDACESLNRGGFYQFVCFTGHLGPRQLTAIEEAGKLLKRRAGGTLLFRLAGSYFRKGRQLPTLVSANSAQISLREVFKAPFKLNPIEHAAKDDTSIALHAAPHLVDPIYKEMPPHTREPSIKKRKAYWGASPAEAKAEFGETWFQQNLNDVFIKLRAVWDGANPNGLFRSWYSVLPPNWSFFRAWVVAGLFFTIMIAWTLFVLQSLLSD